MVRNGIYGMNKDILPGNSWYINVSEGLWQIYMLTQFSNSSDLNGLNSVRKQTNKKLWVGGGRDFSKDLILLRDMKGIQVEKRNDEQKWDKQFA